MAKLILLQEGKAIPFELDKASMVIGRLPECDIQLNSNMVSRQHAKVSFVNGRFLLEDLGSGNGTFVNGKKIEAPTPMEHDARVKIGPLKLRFDAEDGSVSSSEEAVKQAAAMDVVFAADGASTIVGQTEAGGFGLLDVQPQAKLKAILEISRSLAGTHDVDSLLPKILDTLFTIFPHADRGVILLQDSTGELRPRTMKTRREDDDDSVKLSRTVLKQVTESKQAILSADAASDARFQASESLASLTIRSMMCVPMLSLQNEVMGIINIDTQNAFNQFTKDDLDIMIAVAGQAALTYEGARLLKSYVEKQKQDSEMEIARNVQRALLPETLPDVDGYEFFATYEAAQAVGGDYYDIIPLDNGRLCLAFGDVAGKGVPASLVMSRISSAVRGTVDLVHDAADAVERINNHMCAKAVEGRFVTFVLTILDTVQHTMTVVNAGHMSPLIRKASGEIEEFDEDSIGIPLGVMEDFSYEAVQRPIAPGELVVIYTDGVSEAMNPKGDLYGIERLKELVKKTNANGAGLGKVIREDVKRHANGRAQNDDITMMVFGRLNQ